MTEAEAMIPKVSAIAPWFGGKRTLAPRIVQEIGPHVAYFEPFCGGMSVLMAKPRARMEVVNDLHGDVINLARVMAHRTFGPQLYRRLRRMVVSDEELATADERIRHTNLEGDDLDAARALDFFVVSWMGRNGEVGLKKNERGRNLCARWSANGGDPATRFRNVTSSIPEFSRRLRGVTVLRRDGFDVIDKIQDVAGTAIYCDPPYIDKSDQYQHDFHNGFMGDDDHARLARALRRFSRARVVVSYYDHPRLAELYLGWTQTKVMMSKHLSNPNGKPKEALEVLLSNGLLALGSP